MLAGEEHRRAPVQHISPEAAAHTFAWKGLLGQRDELMRLLRILKNRRWLIALITAALTLATLVAVFQIKPRYVATAKLLLDPQVSRYAKTDMPVLPGMLVDREVIESEMQILTSRKLAAKTVDKLGLVNDPEFNSELEPKSALASMVQTLRTIVRDLLAGGTEQFGEVDPAVAKPAEVGILMTGAGAPNAAAALGWPG